MLTTTQGHTLTWHDADWSCTCGVTGVAYDFAQRLRRTQVGCPNDIAHTQTPDLVNESERAVGDRLRDLLDELRFRGVVVA